jgi:hypothetical protein
VIPTDDRKVWRRPSCGWVSRQGHENAVAAAAVTVKETVLVDVEGTA